MFNISKFFPSIYSRENKWQLRLDFKNIKQIEHSEIMFLLDT